MQIPFIGGAYTAVSPNINAQKSINCYPVIDNMDAKTVISMYGTPGLKVFSAVVAESAYTAVRAVWAFGSVIYAVIGSGVYSITSAGVATSLGSITTSSGNVFMSDNGTQVIIVDGTAYGHYIQSGVLYDITDEDFPAAASVTFQDGYFIVVKVGTGQIWISGLYDVTTWDALDFATAEGSPDNALNAVSNTHDLWIFGERSTEIFYNSGNSDFPFERISGAFIEVGIGAAASVAKINGQMYWLTDNGQVVRNAGYQFQVISTDHIAFAISGYAVISDAIAWTYNLNGHDFYVLTFPTAMNTWVFDTVTNHWHEWESYANKDNSIPWSRHRGNCCCLFGRKTIVGDYENGTLYELDSATYTDNSEVIRRIRQAQTISKDRNRVIFHSIELEFEGGVGLTGGVQGEDPQACLSWSDDGGRVWSNEHWRSIGKIGERNQQVTWNRLGMSRNRVFRLVVSDPVKFVLINAFAELEALNS